MPMATNRFRTSLLAGAAVAASLVMTPTLSHAGTEAGGEVGILTCHTVPGTRLNLIVHSTTDITCEFKDSDGTVERYKGETGIGLGVDLHVAHDETIRFTVLAKHFRPDTHQLSGKYHGAKAGATVGIGGGAALLVGGSHDSIGLKPAISHASGVGVAAGLGYLYLEPNE